ncbi:MAG: 30S ribosomal protein S1 [Bacteroidetes bacterium]|nr:MAG: 30S ribosomal protein S1 [Bacteroidota bacterium]
MAEEKKEAAKAKETAPKAKESKEKATTAKSTPKAKQTEEKVKEAVAEAVEKVTKKAKEVVEEVKETVAEDKKETAKVAKEAKDSVEEVVEEATKTTKKVVKEVKEKVAEVEKEVAKVVEEVKEKVEKATAKTAATSKETAKDVKEAVVEVAEKIEEKAEEIVKEAKKTITKTAKKVAEKVEEVKADIEEAISGEDNKPKSGIIPVEDFDRDEFQSDEDYTDDEKTTLDEIYSGTLTKLEEHEVIEGTVIAVGKKEIIVNIGYKSEGVIAASEFRYNPELKNDDKVEVYIESMEDKNGQMILSHKIARMHSAWDRVNASLENNEIITGFVKCRTKGGLIADVFGLEAFLPGSQIDVKPIRDYDVYVGKNMEFKVVKINQEFKNVVVSHKALIEAELEEQKKQIIAGLEKGQVLEGTVKNITSYGVFIDLGGVDGLIHITDLSWSRINHPEEVVELDQKLNVVILDFDDDKSRIALGLKQLQNHPWDNLDEKMKVGDKVKGKVVVLADYGAFVEIASGVEGLVHVSEMSWSQHLRSAQDFLKIGDEVDCVVLTLDREERKMSLGIKQLTPDPWEGIEERYPVGSKYKAKVKNFTNFGVFVEIEEGVDGLIHISDLSWSKKVKHPSEFCTVGDELEVVVLDVDREGRRLSLGHKQLEENPWDVFETVFTIGSVHPGTVIALKGTGAIIALPYGVEGYCSKKHLKKEDGTEAKADEQLDFKVLEFNKNARKIVVSHTNIFEESVEEAKKAKFAERKASQKIASKTMKQMSERLEKSTLGDFSVLSQLKDEMQKDEETNDKKTTKKK